MSTDLVAVRATEERYRALKHPATGDALDPKTGKGVWPADQNTYRMRDDGAVRVSPLETDEDREASAAGGDLGRAVSEPASSHETPSTAVPAPASTAVRHPRRS